MLYIHSACILWFVATLLCFGLTMAFGHGLQSVGYANALLDCSRPNNRDTMETLGLLLAY